MNQSVVVIRLTALVYLAYGILFGFWPEWAMDWVTGAALSTPSAVVDVRATYGGMSLGIACILWVLSAQKETVNLGLKAALFLMLGMAATRLLGVFLATSVNRMMWIYLAIEVGLALYSVILLKTRAGS